MLRWHGSRSRRPPFTATGTTRSRPPHRQRICKRYSVAGTNGGPGITVGNNTGGTIGFTGTPTVLMSGASTAVNLTSNTGATIDFTNGGLQITTTSGTGFNA